MNLATSRALKKLWKTPDYRKAQLLSRKKAERRVSVNLARSKAGRISWRSSARRKQHQEELQRRWKDPIFINNHKKALSSLSFRTKRSKYMKSRWRDPSYRAKMLSVIRKVVSSKTSKVQISIFRSLCFRGFRGIRLNYLVGNYFADIAFPELKVAIELDGPFHRERVSSDLRRDAFFWLCGWRVFRLPARRKSLLEIQRLLKECHASPRAGKRK